MSLDERTLAEERGVISARDIAFAFWDGSFPPPAEIRCSARKHEQLSANVERVAGCMLLDGHAGEHRFR